jgi:hypothetical protein
MIVEVRSKGSLINYMVVYDFSPGGLFKDNKGKLGMLCVALTLLISELSSKPWEH